MLGRSLKLKAIFISITLITIIVTANYVFNSATASDTKPVPVYEKNENGETYGSGLQASSPETEPVLVSAVGEGGIQGYVRSKDLRGVEPKNPQEALAQQKQIEAAGGRIIPLYAVDGKTIIGTFKLD